MTDAPIQRLLAIMRRLRDPQGGCPWDLQQTWSSLAPYTLEEASEVVDALERGDLAGLRDELGDLLFQVVFLAQLGAEEGRFDFDSVAAAIADKLVRRHPHVFAPEEAGDGDLSARWEGQKAGERAARGQAGALDDIPLALPALVRASKLGRRAARVGFDWDDAAGARAKVLEEIAEVDAAAAAGEPSSLEEEVGDLLLAATSWSRQLGVDPERALRAANRKFESRFRAMEAAAAARGTDLASLDAAGLDALWELAKRG
jgi:nucleoside triphosphate diphosphatase